MDFMKLNEQLSRFCEEKTEFELLLIKAMERISNDNATEEDIEILKEFNNVLLNDNKLSSSIYKEILKHNSDNVNALVDSLKGTKTYNLKQSINIDPTYEFNRFEKLFKEIITQSGYTCEPVVYDHPGGKSKRFIELLKDGKPVVNPFAWRINRTKVSVESLSIPTDFKYDVKDSNDRIKELVNRILEQVNLVKEIN